MKILIGINSLTSMPFAAYSNHIQSFFKLGRWAEKNGHEIILNNPERMSIDRMRNQCAQVAIQTGCDYLLFWDDDVLVPTLINFMDFMIQCEADIVAGDVIIRGYPFNHMAFLRRKDEPGLFPIENLNMVMADQGGEEIINVDAVGFSLCLIKVSLLEKIPKPWFITGLTNTEDIYFCLKAKEYDQNVIIKLDTRIQCGHILWQEIIRTDNKEHMKRYTEAMYPFLEAQLGEKKQIPSDRGSEYLDDIERIMSK